MVLLTVGTLAQKAGVCADTIRNYEREGLLNPIRDSIGRRLFTNADIAVIRGIYKHKARKQNRCFGAAKA